MKKILIGCGVVALLAVAIAVAIGFVVVQSVRGMIQTTQKTGQIYADVNREIPFKAPASNALTVAQLDRWLAVRKALMPSVEAFKGAMAARKSRNPLTMLTLMSEQSTQVVTAHAAALRARKMSAEEYFWIARRVWTVLHGGDAQKDPDLKQLVAEQRKLVGQIRANQQGPGGPGPRGGGMEAMAVQDMTAQEILSSLATIKSRKQALLETTDLTLLDSIAWGFSQSLARRQNAQGREGAPGTQATTAGTATKTTAVKDAATTATLKANALKTGQTSNVPKADQKPAPTPVNSNAPKTVGVLDGLAAPLAACAQAS